MALARAAAQQGKGYVADKPTVTHHTVTGQFRITNYLSTNTYTVGGSATRSTDIITVTSSNGTGNVTSKAPGKSLVASSATTCERKAYTCAQNFSNSTQHDWINATPGACHGDTAPCPGSGVYCTDTTYNCQHADLTRTKDGLPSGYTDSYSEWWKVT
jgi:hypothetical protein